MSCIIAGCDNIAENNLSIRCRRRDTSAIWAPNSGAYLCDEHAGSGLRITVILESASTGQIETKVISTSHTVDRVTPIKNKP